MSRWLRCCRAASMPKAPALSGCSSRDRDLTELFNVVWWQMPENGSVNNQPLVSGVGPRRIRLAVREVNPNQQRGFLVAITQDVPLVADIGIKMRLAARSVSLRPVQPTKVGLRNVVNDAPHLTNIVRNDVGDAALPRIRSSCEIEAMSRQFGNRQKPNRRTTVPHLPEVHVRAVCEIEHDQCPPGTASLSTATRSASRQASGVQCSARPPIAYARGLGCKAGSSRRRPHLDPAAYPAFSYTKASASFASKAAGIPRCLNKWRIR